MTRIDLIFKMRLQESDVSCSIFRDRGPIKNGGVAQLGEHLPCKQGVKGSIPFISTINSRGLNKGEVKRNTKNRKDTGL